MTSDDARKLLGGYATGSLSEAERKALFEAALEDQELFNELSDEVALKEVLDEPGARQRLLAALEPPRHRAWLWVTVAATLAGAVVIGVVVSQRTAPPAPQQIAQVLKSPEPVVTTPAAPAPEPPPPEPKRNVAPAAARAPAPAAARAPAPEQPPPPPESRKEEALADRLQEAKPASTPQAAAGAVRQFAAARVSSTFAFNYSVGGDGFLAIVPEAPGLLSVTNADAVLFPSAAVPGGTPVRIQIPPAVTSVVIGFSSTPGITGSPVRRDSAVGRETDQDPPNGKILIQLFLPPATR